MRIQVICTVFKRAITLRRFIDCFILQTSPDWVLHIIHDGDPTPEIKATMALYDDPRITFASTPQVNGNYGHPNRKMMLEKLKLTKDEFVLITNDDNQYVAKFVEYFLAQCTSDVGFVFCDTVHSYIDYNVLKSRIQENYIDMGSFIVRGDIAKSIGFNHTHLSADGRYAVECAERCLRLNLKRAYIGRPLFIHN